MTSAEKQALQRAQLEADIQEARPSAQPPDDARKPITRLRYISRREERYRDRGEMVFAPKALSDNRPDPAHD